MLSPDERVCSHCGKPLEKHSLADITLCIYGGQETVDGRPFDRSDAEAVTERVIKRLERWTDKRDAQS